MKYIKILFLGAVLIFSGTGCEKILDKEPISSIGPENFWKTKKDADAFNAGIYNQMQTTLRTNIFDWGEVRSDNVIRSGTGTTQAKLLNNVLSANDSDLNGVVNWGSLYRTISLCNVAIVNLPGMIEANYENQVIYYRDLLGQAYAMRALMYFYALRVWGGVPIVNEPVLSVTEQTQFPRASVDEVKAQILSDIEESLKTIGSATNQKYYLQKPAVYALLTDVSMWFQDYDAAIAASDKLVANSAYSWVTNIGQWKEIFTAPATSSETIFNMFWDPFQDGDGVGICQKLSSATNTNQYKVSPEIFTDLYNRVDPVTYMGDGRYAAMFDNVPAVTPPDYQDDDYNEDFGKFVEFDAIKGEFKSQANDLCDIKMPIYRYADVMLLRAEALNQKGLYQQALDIVNKVRSRVGYMVEAKLSDYSGDIKTGIQKTILLERQLELVGEGKRWFDLCRIGNTYDFTNNGYWYLREEMNPVLQSRPDAILFEGAAMGRILYPIASAVINANPLLKGHQNPPYDE